MRAGDGGVVPGLGEEERGVAGGRGGVTAVPMLQTGQSVRGPQCIHPLGLARKGLRARAAGAEAGWHERGQDAERGGIGETGRREWRVAGGGGRAGLNGGVRLYR